MSVITRLKFEPPSNSVASSALDAVMHLYSLERHVDSSRRIGSSSSIIRMVVSFTIFPLPEPRKAVASELVLHLELRCCGCDCYSSTGPSKCKTYSSVSAVFSRRYVVDDRKVIESRYKS